MEINSLIIVKKEPRTWDTEEDNDSNVSIKKELNLEECILQDQHYSSCTIKEENTTYNTEEANHFAGTIANFEEIFIRDHDYCSVKIKEEKTEYDTDACIEDTVIKIKNEIKSEETNPVDEYVNFYSAFRVVKNEEQQIEMSEVMLRPHINDVNVVCKEEIIYKDDIKDLKTEIQDEDICCDTFNVDQNVQEYSDTSDVEEKIDISEVLLDSSESVRTIAPKQSHGKEEMKGTIQNCHICPYQTRSKFSLKRHINSIHNKHRSKLDCQFCAKSFVLKVSLDDHLIKNHKQELQGYMKDFITNKVYTCKICNSYKTTKKISLNHHIFAIHNEQNAKIKCQFCDKSFTIKWLLDNHLMRNHKQEIKSDMKKFISSKIYKCKICSYETTHKGHYDSHTNSVHNKQNAKINCQFCNKSFTSKQSLNIHLMQNHKQETISDTTKIHRCQICFYETSHKGHFKTHMNSVHDKQNPTLNCQFCCKSFTSKRTLDNHLMQNHKQKIKSDMKNFITTKIHQCEICFYETTHKGHFNTHMNSVHKKHEPKKIVKARVNCLFCGTVFMSKRTLDEHLVKNHTEKLTGEVKDSITNQVYKCNHCNTYKTTHKIWLNNHINAIHNKQSCQFCDETFVSKLAFDDHLLKYHKQELTGSMKDFITNKIYKCNICNAYETTQKKFLNNHIYASHKIKIKATKVYSHVQVFNTVDYLK